MNILKLLPGIAVSVVIAFVAVWLENLLPIHVIGAAVIAAIGVNTSFKSMKKAGIRPMIHGFIISALVVVVALVVEIAMGLV